MAELLIVDDELPQRFGMNKALSRNNHNIYEAENGAQALEILEKKAIDVVLLDQNMPGISGLELLSRIQKITTPPLVIIVTAHGSEKIAVEAMKQGAYDYLSKPYDVDELRLAVGRALDKISLLRENQQLRETIKKQDAFGELIGQAPTIQHVYRLIEVAAQSNVTVLICGESGTGKELVAKEIHRRSERSQKPLIATNCAAIPENLIESELFGHEKGAFTGAGESRKGKIEEANGGTLFLDEIGDMSPNTQAKILRVLQDCSFQKLGSNKNIQADVRFIAATNKDLAQEIEDGNFREDLYYRIKVLDIFLPPLRERGNDISLLATHFLEFFNCKYHKHIQTISPQAMQMLLTYHWPGNIRQLKNIIERSVLLCNNHTIQIQELPSEIVESKEKLGAVSSTSIASNIPLNITLTSNITTSFKEAKRAYVQDFERQFIIQRLKQCQGNITQTANSLEIPRQSLQQKLKELGIHVREVLSL